MISLFGIAICLQTSQAQAPVEKFLGRWALTIPNGRAGWLEVTREDGYYDAHILWGGGSVLLVDSVVFPNRNTLMITRSKTVMHKDAQGEVTGTQRFIDTIRASGVKASLVYVYDGAFINRNNYRGWTRESIRPDQSFGTQSDPKIWIIQEIENTKDNGLGIADRP